MFFILQCCYVRLLVLERHICNEDKGVLDTLGHVGVACTVVENQALDELGVHLCLVHHRHDLHHEQVNRLIVLLDREHTVDAGLCERVGELGVHLGLESGACNLDQKLAIGLGRLLERLEELNFFFFF